MKKWLIVLFAALILQGCGGEKHDDQDDHSDHSHHEFHAEEDGVVHIKPEFQKMIELQLETVTKEKLVSAIEVVGEIAQETDQVAHIAADREGVLDSYLVDLGATVDEGTPLCTLRLKDGESSTLKADSHGTVLAKYLKIGDSVDTLTSIMTIADPDLMRAGFDIYERDLSKVSMGQTVKVKSAAYPGQLFDGKIVFISPRVDSKSRTIKIRVDIENEEHLLKFGMFVTGQIEVPTKEEVLFISQKAIQQIEDEQVVFMPSDEEDEFLIREVKAGRQINGKAEILSGLTEGERIVTEGSFYLKSELLKGDFGDGHNH